LPVAGNWI